MRREDRTVELKEPVEVVYGGGDTVIYPEIFVTQYADNDNTAVILIPISKAPSEYITLSVNIRPLYYPRHFTLDANNRIVEQVKQHLIDQEIIGPVDGVTIPSGFVEYPLYELLT